MEGQINSGVPFAQHHVLKSRLQDQPAPDYALLSQEVDGRSIKIRTADTHGQRNSASILLNRMYASRGYLSTPLPREQLPTRLTLVASDHDETIGTMTVGFDSDAGLHVDELFAQEIDALRAEGRKVCEFTKLAMDSVVKSKQVLASLFHVAYIYAHRMMDFDDLMIEVNPRHVRYYQKMLGFEVIGEQRMNPRVNAPAVLLRLDLAHAYEQIARFGGKPEFSLVERSLYPYFFSAAEEAGIIGRLKNNVSRPASYLPRYGTESQVSRARM